MAAAKLRWSPIANEHFKNGAAPFYRTRKHRTIRCVRASRWPRAMLKRCYSRTHIAAALSGVAARPRLGYVLRPSRILAKSDSLRRLSEVGLNFGAWRGGHEATVLHVFSRYTTVSWALPSALSLLSLKINLNLFIRIPGPW